MIFLDASAMVSILGGESDGDAMADRLERASVRLCSAISIWETVAAMSLNFGFTPMMARRDVEMFRQEVGLKLVAIGETEAELAAVAYTKFGKGRHPAALNMGDCFAYACAKANNAKLLFKGEDFSKTDIAVA
jgi:ribonuclease VapC